MNKLFSMLTDGRTERH